MAISNLVKVCGKNTSGNSKVFYSEVGNITSITITGGEVAAVTMSSTNKFHEFDADLNTINFIGTGTGKTSYSKTQALKIGISKKTTATIAAVKSLADAVPCGVVAIRLDNNGQAFLSGWSDNLSNGTPYNQIDDVYDSGTTRADESPAQSYEVTLTGTTDGDEIPMDATVNATIIAETAAFITFN
uniref:Uncharacterized protein n=1 Tax=uncultured marine virus TaxID=186617 RepID=A0A0F7L7Z0_9VIRU|nr:hypothetical protein [uncultured marine virus]